MSRSLAEPAASTPARRLSGDASVGSFPEARSVTAASADVVGVLAGYPRASLRSSVQREVVADARRRARDFADGFLRDHVDRLYDEVTANRTRHLRLAEVCDAVAGVVPGLVPTREGAAAELRRPLADKEGTDVDQSILIAHLLRSPTAGPHLMAAMRRPTARALRLLPELAATGVVATDSVLVEVRDGAAHLTMRRVDCLNAEDDAQVEDMETAVDLALLSEDVRVGVLRGGEMTHPRYAGRRVFSSGINLRSLHAGKISFVDFLLRREMGFLAKIVHGLSGPDDDAWDGGAVQKPWIAAVESFAIGGGAQIVLACDRVLVERGAYVSLPAASEGIIPGVANLRLGRIVGARVARQMVLADRRIGTDDPEARLLFDEVVDPGGMDDLVRTEAARLATPAVAANRRMLNLADEPPESFRAYLAEFAVQQARRVHSEDVLAKVTRFSARQRS
jgi:thioesterase DpgC